MLLPYGQAAFEKAVSQRVLVDLLEMSVPEIAMSTERGFANHCAEFQNPIVVHGAGSCAFEFLFCQQEISYYLSMEERLRSDGTQ
jgi:hypothetical protein